MWIDGCRLDQIAICCIPVELISFAFKRSAKQQRMDVAVFFDQYGVQNFPIRIFLHQELYLAVSCAVLDHVVVFLLCPFKRQIVLQIFLHHLAAIPSAACLRYDWLSVEQCVYIVVANHDQFIVGRSIQPISQFGAISRVVPIVIAVEEHDSVDVGRNRLHGIHESEREISTSAVSAQNDVGVQPVEYIEQAFCQFFDDRIAVLVGASPSAPALLFGFQIDGD